MLMWVKKRMRNTYSKYFNMQLVKYMIVLLHQGNGLCRYVLLDSLVAWTSRRWMCGMRASKNNFKQASAQTLCSVLYTLHLNSQYAKVICQKRCYQTIFLISIKQIFATTEKYCTLLQKVLNLYAHFIL